MESDEPEDSGADLSGCDELCRVRGTVTVDGDRPRHRLRRHPLRRSTASMPDRWDRRAWSRAGLTTTRHSCCSRCAPPRRSATSPTSSPRRCSIPRAGCRWTIPRLSTTYAESGLPSRTNLELWIGEGDNEFPRRVAGEAAGDGAVLIRRGDGAAGDPAAMSQPGARGNRRVRARHVLDGGGTAETHPGLRVGAIISDFGGVLTSPLRGLLPGLPGHLGRPAGGARHGDGRDRRAPGRQPAVRAGDRPAGRGRVPRPDRRAALRAAGADDRHGAASASATSPTWTPNEPMIGYMRELRERGYKLAICTNNVREWEHRWRAMLPVEEIFDVVVDSAFVGTRKPEPRIYELTLEALGVDAGSALLIDDIEANCAGARERGDRRGLVSAHRAGDRRHRGGARGGGEPAGRRGRPAGRRHCSAAAAVVAAILLAPRSSRSTGDPRSRPAGQHRDAHPPADPPHPRRSEGLGLGRPQARSARRSRSGFLGFSFEFQGVRAYTGSDPAQVNPVLVAAHPQPHARARRRCCGSAATAPTSPTWPGPGVKPLPYHGLPPDPRLDGDHRRAGQGARARG